MRNLSIGCTATVLAMLYAGAVAAQEHQDSEGTHEMHRNHLALFLGGTSKVSASELPTTVFTIGADYERRLGEFFGIGLAVDAAIGEHDRDFLVLLPVFAHPVGGWKLLVAPGVEVGKEVVDEGDVGAESEGETGGTEGFFALRLGMDYAFDFGRFSIAPGLYFDIIGQSQNAWVYGLVFGYGF